MSHIIKVESLTRTFRQYQKQPGIKGTFNNFFNRKYYDIHAVNNVSFAIDAGTMVGFLGPNGAGKTTTLKMLSGVLHPSSGKVEVMGFRPYQRLPEFQKQFGLVMGQKSQLWRIFQL